MAFIGNSNTTQGFTPAIDYFNGNGSTTAFTLSRPVASVAQVQVVIENVPQNPGSAYTVSGNTITFTSAPPSGTSNIYVYYTSPITQVIAPGQGTVGLTQISATGTASSSTFLRGDGSWTNQSSIAAGSATNLAGGAAGNLHYQSGTGTTAFVSNGTSGQVLQSNGAAAPSWTTISTSAFAAGTAMLFVQTAAPTGWTKSTTHNDKALRVVSGTASTGGSVAFTTAFAGGLSAGSTTLSTAEMPAHSHTAQVRNGGACSGTRYLGLDYGTNITTSSIQLNNTGGGGSHNHTLPSFAVSYVDVIIATKD